MAYIDESGIHDGSLVFAAAGYLAPADEWKAFSEKWMAVLDSEGVRELHMRAFAHSRDEFRGWDEERKAVVLGRLIDVLNETVAVGHSCLIYRGTEKDWQNTWSGHLMVRPYAGSLPHCIVQLARRSPIFLGEDEKIGFVCGRNREWNPKAFALYQEMRVAPEFDFRDRLGAITFESPRECAPLQAADLLAYDSRRRLLDWRRDPASEPRRSALRLETGRVTHCTHDKEELEPVFEKVLTDPSYPAEMKEHARQRKKRGLA
jgi:hypothetical protein